MPTAKPNSSLALFLSLLPLIWLVQSCAPIDSPTPPLEQYQIADTGQFPIRYQRAGTPAQPLVVFIHGTPGSSQAFQHLLEAPKLKDCCDMIAVDRLGFGESAASNVQPDFGIQAEAIAQVFSENQSGRPILVVGHSLGGSIAVQVAISYPDHVGALLIISSALDPQLSGPRWYQRLADLPIIKQLIPDALHRANEEMLGLQPALENIENGWRDLTIPITIVQGGKDLLVARGNPKFVEQKLSAPQLNVHRFPDD